MSSTLTFLPVEILYRIARYLSSCQDVSNFRLACKMLGEIGLLVLLPEVTVEIFPESLARLQNISLHPIFKHHVFTLIFLIDIFHPYNTFNEWKEEIDDISQNEEAFGPDFDMCRLTNAKELSEGWMSYRTLLAAQEEALKAIHFPEHMQETLQRLANLKHLEIRFCKGQDYRYPNPMHHSIFKKHPYIWQQDHIFYPADESSIYGLPGIEPLKLLLSCIRKPGLQTLRVEPLDAQFFNTGGHADFDIHNLRTLHLSISYQDFESSWKRAKRTLATGRLKAFLSSAPHLEDIDLKFGYVLLGHGLNIRFYPSILNIIPREYSWPHLKRLRLSIVEIAPLYFLDFLNDNKHSLRVVELDMCKLPMVSTQGVSCWSDLFVPLALNRTLEVLALSGLFYASDQYHQPDIELPYISMDDAVSDMELTVGEAMQILVCSADFDSFLRREVATCLDFTAGAIKKGIIQDLMDYPPSRPSSITMRIPTNLSRYLKSFSLVTDSLNWGRCGMWRIGHDQPSMSRLETLEVPGSDPAPPNIGRI